MSYWSEKLHLYSKDKKKLRKCEKEILNYPCVINLDLQFWLVYLEHRIYHKISFFFSVGILQWWSLTFCLDKSIYLTRVVVGPRLTSSLPNAHLMEGYF